jgi:hypothetical protein
MDPGDGRFGVESGAPPIRYGAVAREPTRRIVLLTKLKRTSMRMGAVTQAFFRKGDELVATEFENVPHDDPMLARPKLPFRNFERIPHHRGRIALMLLSLAVLALVVVGRHSLRDLPTQTGRAVRWLGAAASQQWVRLNDRLGSHPGRP